MTATVERRRYRVVNGQRFLVVPLRGVDGYVVRFTDYCTGCTEHGDYGSLLVGSVRDGKVYGAGCEECGFTGRRRREEWMPFDFQEWDRKMDEVLAAETVHVAVTREASSEEGRDA